MPVLVLTLAVLIQAADVAPGAGAPPPMDVCLTNACSPPLKPAATARTVPEAISAGQAHVVRALGGTPQQALAALDTRVRARLAEAASTDPGLVDYAGALGRFGNTADGSILTYFDERSGSPDDLGLSVVGGIERRSPDGRSEVMQLLDNGAGRLVTP